MRGQSHVLWITAVILLSQRGAWAAPPPKTFSIATWNLEWFFDEDRWDVFYQIPQSERDVSDHYPVVATFSLH